MMSFQHGGHCHIVCVLQQSGRVKFLNKVTISCSQISLYFLRHFSGLLLDILQWAGDIAAVQDRD